MSQAKRQRLYWLAEIIEYHAEQWSTRNDLRLRLTREAKEAITDDEFASVLSWLHAGGRIEYKPGKGQRDMIRRVAPPPQSN